MLRQPILGITVSRLRFHGALDQQNVEYDLLQRIYETEKVSIRKLYTYLEWKKFRRDELNICSQFSLCTVPSERDKQVFQEDIPTTPFAVVPNGVDSAYFQADNSTEPESNTILFTGSIDYYPNTDGFKVLYRERVASHSPRSAEYPLYYCG